MESSPFVVGVAEVLVAWLVLSIVAVVVWNLLRHAVRTRSAHAAMPRRVTAPAGRSPIVSVRAASPRTSSAGPISSGRPSGFYRG